MGTATVSNACSTKETVVMIMAVSDACIISSTSCMLLVPTPNNRFCRMLRLTMPAMAKSIAQALKLPLCRPLVGLELDNLSIVLLLRGQNYHAPGGQVQCCFVQCDAAAFRTQAGSQ